MRDFNEWCLVMEDMPMKDTAFENLSIEVDVLTKNGTVTKGFYNEKEAEWYEVIGEYGWWQIKKMQEEAVAWKG